MKDIAVVGTGLSGQLAVVACKELHRAVDWYGNVPPVNGLMPASLFMKMLPISLIRKGMEKRKFKIYAVGSRVEFIRKQWGYDYIVPKLTYDQNGAEWQVWTLDDFLTGFARIDIRPIAISRAMTDNDLLAMRENYEHIFYCFPTQASREIRLPPFPFGMYTFANPGPDISDGWEMYVGDNTPISRICCFQGRTTVEYTIAYSRSATSRFQQWGRVLHPSTMPCREPFAPGIIPIGRWATWDKTYLAYNAYEDVHSALTGGNAHERLV